MIKNKKAFTLGEVMVVITIVFISALIFPFISAKRYHERMQKAGLILNIGDTVYIDSLGVTGVINRVTTAFDYSTYSTVNLIVKSTNGVLSEFNGVDTRLLKKVPFSPEIEWKR